MSLTQRHECLRCLGHGLTRAAGSNEARHCSSCNGLGGLTYWDAESDERDRQIWELQGACARLFDSVEHLQYQAKNRETVIELMREQLRRLGFAVTS